MTPSAHSGDELVDAVALGPELDAQLFEIPHRGDSLLPGKLFEGVWRREEGRIVIGPRCGGDRMRSRHCCVLLSYAGAHKSYD
jgi:hypothetical protein